MPLDYQVFDPAPCRFPRPRVPVWRWDEMAVSACPVARDYRLRLLYLPCYLSLSGDEMDWLPAALSKVLRTALGCALAIKELIGRRIGVALTALKKRLRRRPDGQYGGPFPRADQRMPIGHRRAAASIMPQPILSSCHRLPVEKT